MPSAVIRTSKQSILAAQHERLDCALDSAGVNLDALAIDGQPRPVIQSVVDGLGQTELATRETELQAPSKLHRLDHPASFVPDGQPASPHPSDHGSWLRPGKAEW